MSTPIKRVIDWDGEHEADMIRELRALPPGRYVLVPANELSAGDADFDLSAEQLQGIEESLVRLERGEQGVPMDEYFARRAARRGSRTP